MRAQLVFAHGVTQDRRDPPATWLEKSCAWLSLLAIGACGATISAQDTSLTKGLVPDMRERHLAERFRPIFLLNAEGTYRPASLKTYVEASAIVLPDGRWLSKPSPINEILVLLDGKNSSEMRLQPRATKDFDPEHSEAWAKRELPSVFFRVKRDFPKNTYSFELQTGYEYVSVQYFFFCYFNDADWGCLDLTFIVSSPDGKATWENPTLHSAVFHNHGRQMWLDNAKHGKLELDGGRIVVRLEQGSNEPWPNKGGSGFGGWPKPPGFKINHRFEKDTGIDWPWSPRESRIVRLHEGNGDRIVEYDLIDLAPPGTQVLSPLARFVMCFAGQYGTYGGPHGDPPTGPPYQKQMWERQYTHGNFTSWWEWRGGDSFTLHRDAAPP